MKQLRGEVDYVTAYAILLSKYLRSDILCIDIINTDFSNGDKSIHLERNVVKQMSVNQLKTYIDFQLANAQKYTDLVIHEPNEALARCSISLNESFQIGKLSEKYEVMLFIQITDESAVKVNINSPNFPFDVSEGFLDRYHILLNDLESNEEIKIGQMNLLSMTEMESIQGFSFSTTEWKSQLDKSYLELFIQQVIKKPDAIAIRYEDQLLTYKELDTEANQLAHKLLDSGAGKGDHVGVLMNRSFELVISILAIWKIGAIYIPLDPEFPEERLQVIIDDCKPKIMLTNMDVVNMTDGRDPHGLKMNVERSKLKEYSGNEVKQIGSPNDVAYIIFTSGSTGKPKGVIIEHRGMINHLYVKISDLHINKASVVAQTASHCFDISIWQLFAPLLVGAQVVIYGTNRIKNVHFLLNALERDKITIFECVPSYLSKMLDWLQRRPIEFNFLEYVLVTGETLPVSLVQRWYKAYKNNLLINAYGPTEASDDITHCRIDPDRTYSMIPLGKPVANMKIYIVDDDFVPCPIGVKGEIVVTGIGVGRGYLNRPNITAQRFVEAKVLSNENERFYRTGDLGCWDPCGNILFFGRIDNQVKVRGYRIELADVDHAISTIHFVKQSLTVAISSATVEHYLRTYVQVDTDWMQCAQENIKKSLRDKLPYYMIPTEVIIVDDFPTLPNGKIDVRSLESR